MIQAKHEEKPKIDALIV